VRGAGKEGRKEGAQSGEAKKPDGQATLVAAIFPPSLQCKRKLFSTSILYLVSVNSSIFGK